ncbi:MAG: M48 family metalloprotease [Pseudomonadales bacterium]
MRRNIRNTLVVAMLLLVGCGTNPVTGKRELQFISTPGEIKIGQKNYAPSRQVQGGDYVVDTELTLYVQRVGGRLAKVSDRDLPYEFRVLNSSVPNAWALPGGKIAINRGLLLELNSEAELAAVLGHEIVHAAARHGAKAQERGMIIQGGLLATQIATQDKQNAALIAGGSMLGAQLLTTRYGRSAELESDFYGMEYMARAGYDPKAAIDLQKTFVRLSASKQSNFLQGLFASHPPSQKRVDANIVTAEALAVKYNGKLEMGRESYKRAIAQIKRDKAAYDAQDKALAAAKKKDYKTANSLVDKAIKLQPREAKFYGLKGDLALNGKNYKQAVNYYEQAIQRYPEYFAFYLHSGMAKKALGDRNGAKKAFTASNKLLPTPTAHKELGELSLASGDRATALQHFQVAAQSKSAVGQSAAASMTRLELPENPGKYIKASPQVDNNGNVVLVVRNMSLVPVRNVKVVAAETDANGNQVSRARNFVVRNTIPAQKYAVVKTPWANPNVVQTKVQSASLAK